MRSKNFITFIFISALAPLVVKAQGNYVRTYTPITPISDLSTLQSQSTDRTKVQLSTVYYDGLGRPIQQVQRQGSPQGKDLVQPMAYDQYGIESTKYLPYADNTATDGAYKANAFTAQQGFYFPGSVGNSGDQQGNGIVIIPHAYSVTGFERSPLNRPTVQGAPGESWQLGQHTAGTDYATNDASGLYAAKLFGVSVDLSTGVGNLLDKGSYPYNSLSVHISHDENWTAGQSYPKLHTIEEYTDREGNVVLKRTFNLNTASGGQVFEALSTYYVYDDFGNLTFVLPPGTQADNGFSSAANQSTLDALCYQYRYDERNRVFAKRVPGKDWEYTVYNQLDQPVLTQDAAHRSLAQWLLTKYDNQGRVVLTGLFKDLTATPLTISQLRGNVDAQSLFESRTSSGLGYTQGSYPALSWVFTLNYYDDYTFPSSNIYPAGNTGHITLTQPTGLLTATKAAVLLSDGTFGPMLWTVNYYDDKGRTSQSFHQHYLQGANTTANNDWIVTEYNFNNMVTTVDRTHFTASGSPLLIHTEDKYDEMTRKYQSKEKIGSGNEVLLSQLDYNEIGQLMTKHLHSINGSAFLQDISYAYNERGWLTKINDPNPNIARVSNKYFSEQLTYDQPVYGGTAQYNGNIAEQGYNINTVIDPGLQTVKYDYDAVNRLTGGTSSSGFSETGISYDLIGNLKTLSRNGKGALSYDTYDGNRLMSISGFKSGSYNYDADGNMTGDGTRGATVQYNMINLPRTVNATTPNVINLAYTYKVTGEKLRKVSMGVATDYIDGIQYNNSGVIDFIQTEEGRANNSAGNYSYEYTLTDHLGNNRVTIDQTNGKVGEDDYYPFGYNVHRQQNAGNKYLYNKKEMQEELEEYDYGARFYDPIIARWGSIDNHAEKYMPFSPYAYTYNDPIKNVDIDGNDGVKIIDNETKTITVKATYYVPTTPGFKGDPVVGYNQNDIAKLNDSYTAINQKPFCVTEGEYKGYTVVFDMKFVDGGTKENAKDLSSKDKVDGVSIGNTFTVGDGNRIPYFFPKPVLDANGDPTEMTTTVGGVTKEHNDVTMNSNKDTKRNRIHETWHTLFFDHDGAPNGIGSYVKGDMPNQNDINTLINNSKLPTVKKKDKEKKDEDKQ